MRWTWLLPRVCLVGLIWGFVAFGLDPLLRSGAIQSLQTLTGAKAEIADLRTTFLPPSITMTNVALARAGGAGKNIVQFDRMELKLEPDSLSRRRFVVESGRIDGLKFDTRRPDDGRLEDEPIEPEPATDEPSWITDTVTDLGDEWLDGLEQQLRAQLDPNVLESYRVGRDAYARWDERFEQLEDRAKSFEPRAKALEAQFKQAREGDTLQQIEQYLQVATKAEQLVLDAQRFRDELTGIVPDVRADFASLNAARQRDQELVQHRLSLLRPDARRITEALIGRPMYRQLQQAMTWVDAVQAYRRELQQQTKPERQIGRDIEFLLAQPAPEFLLKNLSLSGEISLNEELIPFQAELCDVTEDPKLLGRPCVLRLRGEGRRPLQLRATWDATSDTPRAELLADYRDVEPAPLRAGRADKAQVCGTLSDLAWTTRLAIEAGRLSGEIQLSSQLNQLSFQASDKLRPELITAANDALSPITSLNATLELSGSWRRPELDLKSDLGDQIADGLQLAFTNQLHFAQERLIAEVNMFASDQTQKLKARFAGEYDQLLADNAKLLEQASEVQSLVRSFQSGNVSAGAMIRQAAQSKLVPEKDRQKVSKALGDFNQVLDGKGLPGNLLDRRPPRSPQ